jgi:TPR repeat protein
MRRASEGAQADARAITAALAKRGCEGQDGAGCVLWAELSTGPVARELVERGHGLLTAACEGGQGDRIACIDLARLSIDPPEFAAKLRDVVAAAALLGAACSRGEAVACYELAERTRSGVSPQEIPALYERPCEAGLIVACTQWGNELFVSGVDPAKGLQIWSRACEAGEPSACTSLASAKLTGAAGQKPEPVAASTLYDRACTLGEPRACTQLGLLASTGRGVRAEPERARKLFAMACQAGEVEGCGQHGVMMIRGLGGAADPKAGRQLVERACTDGHGPSCMRLASLLTEQVVAPRDGTEREVEVSRLHRAACELRDLEGCVALSADHVDGRGVPEDLRLALDLARFACQEGSATGCTLAAEFYRRGQGVVADDTLADRYLHEGCSLGDSHGCEKLAGRSEEAEAAELWKAALVLRTRGCEQEGKAEDCAVLGTYHLLGFAGAPDPVRAVDAFSRGCDGGQLGACTSLGQILVTGTGVTADYERAFATLTRACDGGDIGGCTWLGLCAHKGRGTTVDLEAAKARYGAGCEAGVPFGCIGMARLHEQGDGVKKDAKARRRYLERACKLGETSACDAKR